MAWTVENTAGLPAASSVTTGLHVTTNGPAQVNRTVYLTTCPALGSAGNFVCWANQTNPLGSWSQVTNGDSGVYTNASGYRPTPFCQYASAGGTQALTHYIAYGNDAARNGLNSIDLATGLTATRRFATDGWYLVAHQRRLGILNEPRVAVGGSTITFSDVADNLFVANTVTMIVDPANLGSLNYANAVFPNDLFVAKDVKGLYYVQGDVSSPLIRQLTLQGPMQGTTWGAENPEGLALGNGIEGVWQYEGGSTIRSLSHPQIVGGPMFPAGGAFPVPAGGMGGTFPQYPFWGQLQYANGYLFTPTGYVYHFSTRSWFKTSLPGGTAYPFWGYDIPREKVFAAGTAGGSPRVISAVGNEATMRRSTSYAITLPLFDQDERQVTAREVEIHGQGFGNGGTYTVTLTPAPSAGQPPALPIGPVADVVRFRVGVNAPVIKIRVQAAGTLGSEAPMIARVVVRVEPRQMRA